MPNQPAGTKPPAPTASTDAYREAATQLQLDMAIRYTGNADKDFASLLVAYHKGAIAAARIELEHGTNPQMRRSAKDTIAASEKEIAAMQAWQRQASVTT